METYDASIASKASSVSAADENEDYICDEHSKDTNCNHVYPFVVNQKPSVNTERLKDATIEIEKTEKLFSSSSFEMSQNEEKQMPPYDNNRDKELKHDHLSSLQVYTVVIESENGPEFSNVVIDEEGEEEFDFNSHEKKEKLENQNADALNSFESCDAVLECSPKLSSTLGQRDAGLENVKENHFGMPNSCFSQEKRQIVKPRRPPPPVNLQKI